MERIFILGLSNPVTRCSKMGGKSLHIAEYFISGYDFLKQNKTKQTKNLIIFF